MVGTGSIGSGLAVAVRAVADLLLPESCVGCGAEGDALCPTCGRPLAAPARVAWPTPTPAGLPEPWSVAPYDGAVRAAVLAHKEHGRRGLSGVLGAALATATAAAVDAAVDAAVGAVRGGPTVRPLAGPAVLLVPAPSRPAAVRARGDDPTLRLARRAAAVVRRSGRPVAVAPVLRGSDRLADQAGLDAAARAANLAGSLRLRRGGASVVAGRVVVVVDDVVTTGATLVECARALRTAGATVDAVATVAATTRRLPGVSSDGRLV